MTHSPATPAEPPARPRRRGALIDTPTVPRRWTPPPPPVAAWRTLRCRLAARGLPLTRNERVIAGLKGAHRGERCFILGNGPSLNACDLTRLKNETTFGVNSIFLNRDPMGFDPTYYVVEDVLVAEDRAEAIDAYRGPRCKFFGHYLRRFLAGDDATCWLNVLVDYADYDGFPRFSPDASRRLWVGGTVSYLCLQLAYHMGFAEVYLVGFDHAYTIPETVERDGRRLTSTASDPNHFHGDYFGKGYRWHDPQVERMEVAYRRAKAAFEADGRKVFNATAGGKLEVFDRVAYDALFPPRIQEQAA